jgi:hypothetical protein
VVRTQIQLTGEQARALKELAHQRGVSMAEVIRQAVEREIALDERKAKWDRALDFIDRASRGEFGVDEATDVAANHDFYLDQIYGAKIDRARADRERSRANPE